MLNRRLLALALVAVVLTGCGIFSGGKVDPITISSESAAIVAERAVRTNALYKQFCPTGAIKTEDCARWAEFYPRFKIQYAEFYATYKAALAVDDLTTAQAVQKTLEAMSDQLLIFYLTGHGGNN